MNTDLTDLPKGWVWTSLEKISHIILGQSPPSSTYNTDGKGLPFYQGKLEFGKLYPTPRKWCTAPKKIAEKGDVFISIRAPVGPTNICPEKSAVGRGLAAIRGLGGIESFFILYLMRTYANEIASRGTGTTFDAITGNQLKIFEIPLPPLVEQHRIVAKLETLFVQLDAAVDSLKKAQVQLQRYRRSILKAAFEGELTTEWRERHSDSWKSMNLNEFITLESGSRPKGGVRGILEGIPSLGGEHLNTDGGFNYEKIKYIPAEFFESLNKGRIYPDDIIVVKDGATTGKISFVDNDFPHNRAAVNEHLFIVRVDPKVAFPKYVFYFLFSSKGQQQILSDFRGATVGGISRNFPLKVTVPIPSLPEQEQIVFELERHLLVADEIEATIDAELKRAERLRQSILKHAFSGKLVPQDPNDEPASTLLEKIQEEKGPQQPKRKQTTTKPKNTSLAKQLPLPLD
ncbi:MAG: restriction endonuclease subunit S [Candidatus Poribacteria bacterium]|nr:restriction endonuclease subunit S [Candidatus Poribacteria bacterium]MDE0468053.1 restriction endonuclease subunit S [Candidatus Poribacteria bacterium]